MTPCAECGFTYGATPRPELAGRLRAAAESFGARLSTDAATLRLHRSPEEWSPLEYACHVRDVLLMRRDRVYVALVEDEPSFKPMYRNERVVFDRYDSQTLATVGNEIAMAAELLGRAFEGFDDLQWTRPLVYGFPDPARRDVEWVAHHTLHEAVHHLADIDRLRAAPVSRPDLSGVVVIRPARHEDVARIVELFELGSLVAGKEDPADLAPYTAALAEIGQGPGEVLVAQLVEDVVGACQLIVFRHLQSRGGLCAEVESVHVHPDQRGSGIGRVLMEAAIERARRLGCYRVQLTSHQARPDAHRFYAALGFTPSHQGFKLVLERSGTG